MLGTGLNSTQFLIHHEPHYLFKRFSMFKHIGQDQKLLFEKPDAQVMFVCDKAEIQDLADWANKSFNLESQINTQPF